MRTARTLPGLVVGAVLWMLVPVPSGAGDSIWGTVTDVRSATEVILEAGGSQIRLRLVGIDVPENAFFAAQAKQLVENLVLGKNARMRLHRIVEEDEMLARLFTDDPALGIREVAVELVRAGLVQRQQGFDFEYGELAAAEREARAADRGIWGTPPIQ